MDNRKFQAAASATPPIVPGSPSSGYPTNGNPGTGTPATLPGEFWFHSIGEEIRSAIIGSGQTPSTANLGQLWSAIMPGQSLTANGYQKLPGGLILQWGFVTVNGTANAVTNVTFPIAFPNALLRVLLTYASAGTSGYSYSSGGGTTTSFGSQCTVTSGFNGWYALGY